MTIRPMDDTSDILPVSSATKMCSGADAVGFLAFLRLKLYQGDWWEDEEEGSEILELLRRNRISSGNLPLLSSSISNYLAQTPGVLDVRDADIAFNGHIASYSCKLITGEKTIDFSASLLV